MIAIETAAVAANLIAWCWVATVAPPEWRVGGALLVAVSTVGVAWLLRLGLRTSKSGRSGADAWWGFDAAVRRVATPLSLGGSAALVVWACQRAAYGAKLGGYGSLLVLLVVVATGAKLVAETYLYAHLGGDESPRQASAERLNGTLSSWAKARYALGGLGGIVLPLGAQILAGGAKNIPAVADAGPPAVLAAAAFACLLPGELIERWLFRRT